MTDSETENQVDASRQGHDKRLLFKVAFSAGLVIVLLVICDLGLWVFAPVSHPYPDRANSRHVTLPEPGETVFQPDPKIMPGTERPARFTVNQFGFRSPRLDSVEKPDNVSRIFCLGGSTTECLYVDNDDAWPEHLARLLQADAPPGVNVDVVNTGISGDTTREHINMLAQRVIPFEPDLVIVLAGINDMLMHTARDYSPYRADSRSLYTIASPGNAPKIKYVLCSTSQIARRLVLARRSSRRRTAAGTFWQDLEGRWMVRLREIGARKEYEPLPIDHKWPHPEYGQNLRSLVGICRANNVNVVFVTQPALYRPDLSEEERSLLYFRPGGRRYPPEDMARLLESFNEQVRAVGTEMGVPVIDLAKMLPRDTSAFYDDCHFNKAGCGRVAQVLAETLLQSKELWLRQEQE